MIIKTFLKDFHEAVTPESMAASIFAMLVLVFLASCMWTVIDMLVWNYVICGLLNAGETLTFWQEFPYGFLSFCIYSKGHDMIEVYKNKKG